MQLEQHDARAYADAVGALLPPGAAWRWPAGGLGDALLLGTGAELARVEDGAQTVLDAAVETHRPITQQWRLQDYRALANAVVDGVTEVFPRQRAAVGMTVGRRLWSAAGEASTFPVELVRVDHLVGPRCVGSTVGQRLWGPRSRYLLRVRYYRSVVDPAPLWAALTAFKQAHVALWFEDITGAGGLYAQ